MWKGVSRSGAFAHVIFYTYEDSFTGKECSVLIWACEGRTGMNTNTFNQVKPISYNLFGRYWSIYYSTLRIEGSGSDFCYIFTTLKDDLQHIDTTSNSCEPTSPKLKDHHIDAKEYVMSRKSYIQWFMFNILVQKKPYIYSFPIRREETPTEVETIVAASVGVYSLERQRRLCVRWYTKHQKK